MDRPDGDCVGQALVQDREIIGQNQAAVVSLLENSFNALGVIRVTFPVTIVTALVGDPDDTLTSPHEKVDIDSEVVHGRIITVVPPPFVSALLDRNHYVVVDAWQLVQSICVVREWEVSCAPFLYNEMQFLLFYRL